MELECTMDEQDVVVLDSGSGYLKVGFSGEDAPRAVLPTLVATTTVSETANQEHEVAVDSGTGAQKKSQSYYGKEALEQVMRKHAEPKWPVRRGEISLANGDKDALEALWKHTWHEVLGIEQQDLPVLLADAMPLGQAAYPARMWAAEVMFETLRAKSLAIFNSAVLSLFSTGRTRGLVVESGEGLTQAVPIFEGYAIPHAIFKMKVAGGDITTCVQQRMEEEKHRNNYFVMQALKEKVCRVAPDYNAAINGPDHADEESKSFELPDHTIIKVSQHIRTGAPEVLFGGGNPKADSMQRICLDSINTCDLDLQQDLVRSIIVAGGTSMLPGLAPRLKSELLGLLPGELSRQVDVIADSQRRCAAWIGGSMFASLSTFDQVAISKQEYEEGKTDLRSLVAKKTF